MKIKVLFYIAFLILAISSCTTTKDLVYFQNEKENTDSAYIQVKSEYKIQPLDVLYISIKSSDDNLSSIFTNDSKVTNAQFSDMSLYIKGYKVNSEGEINLPVIGEINIENQSVENATKTIQGEVDKYLLGATVIVKLVSFKVSILGEVKRPGTYSFYKDNVSILDVLALAGDLTSYGDRKEIQILRTNNDKTEILKINLLDRSIFSDKNYYLKANDIVYIKPIKNKALRIAMSEYSVFLTALASTLTTLILILSLTR